MRNIQIAPSILSAQFLDLKNEIREIEKAGAEVLHLDIMDGHFVPNLTFGPMIVKEIRKITSMCLDTHLMVCNPEFMIPLFAEAGSDIITVHQESTVHLHRAIQLIKSLGKKAGVSLNPATHDSLIEYILGDLDLLLLMSVNPGFGGQSFIKSVEEKIANFAKLKVSKQLSYIIEVDGGVNSDNAESLVRLGCDWLVAGSSLFNSHNKQENYKKLKESALKGV